jgi:VanZ family protein
MWTRPYPRPFMGKSVWHSIIAAFEWLGFVGWLALIWYLSSKPGNELHNPLLDLPFGDKIIHVAAFAAGGCLIALALHSSTTWAWKKVLIVSIAAIAVFGVIDEWHQLYTPFRSGGDPFDWLADITGATLGAFTSLPIHGRIRNFTGR